MIIKEHKEVIGEKIINIILARLDAYKEKFDLKLYN